MPRPRHELAAQRSPGGWIIGNVPIINRGGNDRIHILDMWGNILRTMVLQSALDDFARFAHWTTAGMDWHKQMLAYFTALQGVQYFVVRAWWGARLVISLDELRPVPSQTMSVELHDVECNLVLAGLHQLVAELENGGRPTHDRSTDVLDCTVHTLLHFPGLLELAQAIPLLQVLEERFSPGGRVFGGFEYEENKSRLLAQISLRRLGAKPRCHPILTFLEDRQHREQHQAALLQRQTEPIDGKTRHVRLSRIKKSTPVSEVYPLLGAPDYIQRGKGRLGWRYDVDADEPYTLILWLDENDVVTRMVKYTPPFWTGPDVFPSRTHSLLDHDSSTVVAYADELEDGTFVGHRIELDVLQELESSGASPQAELARLLFEGDTSAIHPLADALEEAGDPGASRVRSWLPGGQSEISPGS